RESRPLLASSFIRRVSDASCASVGAAARTGDGRIPNTKPDERARTAPNGARRLQLRFIGPNPRFGFYLDSEAIFTPVAELRRNFVAAAGESPRRGIADSRAV